ncbi:hypothetical protein LZ31DRAFT_542745 [Colletotrichum somersetense]|nr:hypothetical protein LZ31DRAFT_542745 [Colletotrichum somersetense]
MPDPVDLGEKLQHGVIQNGRQETPISLAPGAQEQTDALVRDGTGTAGEAQQVPARWFGSKQWYRDSTTYSRVVGKLSTRYSLDVLWLGQVSVEVQFGRRRRTVYIVHSSKQYLVLCIETRLDSTLLYSTLLYSTRLDPMMAAALEHPQVSCRGSWWVLGQRSDDDAGWMADRWSISPANI